MRNENIENYLRLTSAQKLYKNPNQNDKELIAHQNEIISELKLYLDVLPEKEPAFLKLYIKNLTIIFCLSSTAEKLFLAIISQGFINIKGVVELNTKKKAFLHDKVLMLKDKSRSGLYRAMKELQNPIEELGNAPILIKVKNSDWDDDTIEKFVVNSFIIGSGSWANIRDRRLRTILDHQEPEKKYIIKKMNKDIFDINDDDRLFE
jgi:hypothetical protein